MIIEQSNRLYELLQEELRECKSKHVVIKEYLECSFNKGYQMLQALEQVFKKDRFSNEHEEIQFYKHILPQSKGMVESIALMYLGETCVKKPGEDRAFWLDEKRMAENYIEKNEYFYHYYKSGNSSSDTKYFTSEENMHEGMFDPASEKMGTVSGILSKLIAREKYIAYTEQKLSQ